jgi:hypothetical protein
MQQPADWPKVLSVFCLCRLAHQGNDHCRIPRWFDPTMKVSTLVLWKIPGSEAHRQKTDIISAKRRTLLHYAGLSSAGPKNMVAVWTVQHASQAKGLEHSHASVRRWQISCPRQTSLILPPQFTQLLFFPKPRCGNFQIGETCFDREG